MPAGGPDHTPIDLSASPPGATSGPGGLHLPESGQARTVQIDNDPVRAGNRIPTEVPLVGDAAETLRALLPLLERKADRGFLEQAQEAMAAWREDMDGPWRARTATRSSRST